MCTFSGTPVQLCPMLWNLSQMFCEQQPMTEHKLDTLESTNEEENFYGENISC